MTSFNGQWGRLALASTAALALAACESNGSYRVASVGTTSVAAEEPGDTATNGGGGSSGGSGTGTGTGSGSGGTGSGSGGSTGMSGPLLVTSGNAVIGVAGTTANVTANLGIPGGGIVDAVVTGVIRRTGQTLVQLGGGGTLILGGTGGRIGDVVSLDLGAGKVIGGPNGSPLIGLNVLAQNPSTGRLATVNAASAGKLVSVTVPGLTGAGGTGGLLPAVTPVPQGNAGANAGLVGTVTSTVTGVVSPSSGVGVGSVTNVVTQPLQGVLGVTGVVKPKPPK
ncbi:hypothetical protein P1X14_17430 [Sphingomonas sp. AOB5]|uniref:hypothetical protein n=1 Tax=Sphingomonas sp. AOB5 TaxID=3034017 RepID=UPI0023F92938|nr:hypothetical protein [Sphingomonas sp. AOB5]MDF7777043.1 hypothetical protein [Sphingomonas sp. AOB5]